MSTIRIASLRYNGIDYGPDYCVRSDGKYFRRLKSTYLTGQFKGKRKWKPGPIHKRKSDGYEFWFPKNPVTGRHHPGILAHRTVLESFTGPGITVVGLVAAHRHGTNRSDNVLGTCDWKDQKGNRKDRERDGTSSTYNTAPVKLTVSDVMELLEGWHAVPNKSAWAKKFGCTPQNIRYHLRKLRA
jgi:hypothetical protein